MVEMEKLIRAAAEVQRVLEAFKWKFCFLGGIAVQKWGQARFTRDVDLCVLTGLGGEERFIDSLLEAFPARTRDARKHAVEHRVLLLRTRGGVDVDVSCGGFPFEQKAVSRARKVRILPGTSLRLCTAEDLIVYKAFAARGIDWMDVEGIIAKQPRGKLDWRYIYTQIKPLAELKDEPEIIQKLKEMRRIVEKT
jgi:hypothetical protein